MTRWVYVCAAVLVLAVGALAQPQEYAKAMDRGNALDRAGNYTEAIESFREAAGIAERARLGARPHAAALNALGLSYDNLGRYSDAIRQYRRTLAILEKEDGMKTTGDYAAALGNLAGCYSQLGQRNAAESTLREAIGIYTGLAKQDEARLAILKTALAEALLPTGRHDEADRLLTHALAAFEKRPEMGHHAAIALSNLGVVRNIQKRYPESIPMFRDSVKRLETIYGPDHPKLLPVLNNLGVALYETRDLAEADGVMQRAMSIAEARFAPDHPAYGNMLVNYASVLRKMGRKAEAKALENRGKTAMVESRRVNGSNVTVDIRSFRKD